MPANQSARLRTDIDSLDFLHSPETLGVLKAAADTFVKHDEVGSAKIWASSRDWFQEEWGRDTFVSLPGLLLSTGRYEEARQIFTRFVRLEKDGVVPNVIRQDYTAYNTVDASLWFIHALKAYVESTDDWTFATTILPTIRNIILGYSKGTRYQREGKSYEIIRDASDGLITSPIQATWMDADPSGNGSTPVTPRNGKAVEINALWYGSLVFAAKLEEKVGDVSKIGELEKAAELTRHSFREKFWNPELSCLFDVIEGDPHSAAIRPNQIIAISHGGDLLEIDQMELVLNVVERELLTPGGLRTLSPNDAKYIGEYDTSAPMSIKDFAYHQGAIWPWLVGPYCDALRIVRLAKGASAQEASEEIDRLIAPLVAFCLESEFRSLPEVFSGDGLEPGGTTSQAWSVAEVLRIISK